MSRLIAIALLAAVYLLTLASLAPGDIVAAIVISAVLLAALPRFLSAGGELGARELAGRLVAFPRFALGVIAEIIVGTWRVALIVIGARPLRQPGIVAIPVGERTDTGVAVTALAITLSPGELLVEVDEQRGEILIHVLDASDPQAVRDHYARFYERYQRPVFP